MTGFVNLDAAYDIGTLTDWYISSVTDDPPVRTDEHIEKLFNDFYVIPKDTPAADVAPVKHGEWEEIRDAYRQLEGWMCKKCGRETKAKENYCPNCGAKMDGGENNGT